MTESQLIEQLENAPETVEFDQVIASISENYDYQPTRFTNGDVVNEAGTNEGSCKLFAFGLLANDRFLSWQKSNQFVRLRTLNAAA